MPIKILIVEDSASDRLIIKGILDAYETISARDGLEALRQIDANPDIRLVILDLNMPNMNGFEVLKVFQSEERYQNLSTIILTNYDELESEIKGLQLGAVDYIRKPIHMESIKARIDVHVQLLKAREIGRAHV